MLSKTLKPMINGFKSFSNWSIIKLTATGNGLSQNFSKALVLK